MAESFSGNPGLFLHIHQRAWVLPAVGCPHSGLGHAVWTVPCTARTRVRRTGLGRAGELGRMIDFLFPVLQ